jgi:hypothetical protein
VHKIFSLNSNLHIVLFSTLLTGWVPTLLRAGRGMTLWNKAGIEPSQKLQIFSYENNPVILFSFSIYGIRTIMHNEAILKFLLFFTVCQDCS